MSIAAAKTPDIPAQLPLELWTRVLRYLCEEQDIPGIWTEGRLVCKTFKTGIELLFEQIHLPKTWVQFDLGTLSTTNSPQAKLKTEFNFNRLSSNGNIAIYASEIDPAFTHKDELVARLRSYEQHLCDYKSILYPQHTVQLRHQVNDTPIPGFTIDYETLELHCDWRGMFSWLLSEEFAVDDHSAKWVEGNKAWAQELSKKTARGEIDIVEAVSRSMVVYAEQHRLGVKEARRARIGRQLGSKEKGLEEIIMRGQGESLETRQLERVQKVRDMVAEEIYSDDERDSDDYENDEEEGGDDEWKDEEDSEEEDEDADNCGSDKD